MELKDYRKSLDGGRGLRGPHPPSPPRGGRPRVAASSDPQRVRTESGVEVFLARSRKAPVPRFPDSRFCDPTPATGSEPARSRCYEPRCGSWAQVAARSAIKRPGDSLTVRAPGPCSSSGPLVLAKDQRRSAVQATPQPRHPGHARANAQCAAPSQGWSRLCRSAPSRGWCGPRPAEQQPRPPAGQAQAGHRPAGSGRDGGIVHLAHGDLSGNPGNQPILRRSL